MNIPTNLAEQLNLYLKQQANKGDLEAQTLLAQIDKILTSPSVTVQEAMDLSPPEGVGLGC